MGSSCRRVVALLVAGLVLAQAGCRTPDARRRLLEALFDEPPSKRPPPTAAAAAPAPPPETTRAKTPSPTPRPPLRGSNHGPHAAGLCQGCHTTEAEDPAPGAGARLRRARTDLCLACHRGTLLVEQERVGPIPWHGPVAAGHCLACHLPHRSQEPTLLRAARERICLHCHDPADLTPEHPERGEAACADCHDPHAPRLDRS